MTDRTVAAVTTEPTRHGTLRALLFPIIIIGATLIAYANSFSGVFLFDDRLHILGELRLETLWPPWEAMSRRRMVVDYSFALNYAVSGQRAWSYHAVNLLIHVLASLALFGLVRRTLLLPRWQGRFATSASGLAMASALLWAVHPLQTQAVTYVVQRAECLMGLFYLLTVYAALRASQSAHRVAWSIATVAACILGMGSKGVMVTAPVMVLLYDRAFLADSFKEAVRRRWALHMGLFATWGVLWACGTATGVLNPAATRANVGFGFKGIGPIDYLLTQSGVLVRYLRLSLCPVPLCLDYYWSVARTAAEVVLPGLIITSLLALTVWAWVKRPPWGFIGVWFFVVLAPTSSFIPIKDPMFEHRMYLSLASVVVLATLGAYSAICRDAGPFSLGRTNRAGLIGVTLTLVCAGLGYGTIRRNEVYHSEAGMWADVLRKRPESVRASENYGTALLAENRIEEAYDALLEAVQVVQDSPEIRNGLGFALVVMGRANEAVDWFRSALAINPRHRRARRNLASALLDAGRPDEAIPFAESALTDDPADNEVRLTLGNALLKRGRPADAVVEYRRLLSVDRENAPAWRNLCTALLASGDGEQALAAAREALRLDPNSPDGYNDLGITLATNGDLKQAVDAFRRSIQLKPSFAMAHYNLGKCLLMTDDTVGAVYEYEAALSIDPRHNDARYELGVALAKQGLLDRAIAVYRETLLLDPNHQDARQALEDALADKARSSSE